VECRSAPHECDLPEYCTGDSEYCPDNVFKFDGSACDTTEVYLKYAVFKLLRVSNYFYKS